MKLFCCGLTIYLSLQTACADGIVRVFKLDDASSKSFKYVNFHEPLDTYTYRLNAIVNHVQFVEILFSELFCRFLRINLPAGGHPTAVAFSDDSSSIVVASHTLSGSSLYMYGEDKPKTSENKPQTKLPLPEIKWERHKVHDKKAILTMFGTKASYGSADGSTIIASCSEGIFLASCHIGNYKENVLSYSIYDGPSHLTVLINHGEIFNFI